MSSPCGSARDRPRWVGPARPVPEPDGPVAATGRATGLRASLAWRRFCRRHRGRRMPGRLPDRNPVLDGRSGRCPPRRRPQAVPAWGMQAAAKGMAIALACPRESERWALRPRPVRRVWVPSPARLLPHCRAFPRRGRLFRRRGRWDRLRNTRVIFRPATRTRAAPLARSSGARTLNFY